MCVKKHKWIQMRLLRGGMFHCLTYLTYEMTSLSGSALTRVMFPDFTKKPVIPNRRSKWCSRPCQLHIIRSQCEYWVWTQNKNNGHRNADTLYRNNEFEFCTTLYMCILYIEPSFWRLLRQQMTIWFSLWLSIIKWLLAWLEYKKLPPDILPDYSPADLAQCLNSVERGLGEPDYCSCFLLFLLSQWRGNVLMSGVEDSKKKQMQQEEDQKKKKMIKKKQEESQ